MPLLAPVMRAMVRVEDILRIVLMFGNNGVLRACCYWAISAIMMKDE